MAARVRRRLRQTMRPGCQRDRGRGLAATLAEVPLVNGQRDVQPEVKLIFREEGRDAADDSFVQAARRHERMQSNIELLLVSCV